MSDPLPVVESPADENLFVTNSTLLQLTTGVHPLTATVGTDRRNPENSSQNRFAGFSKYEALVALKQNAVADFESKDSGAGPSGRGWGLTWRIYADVWDPVQKFTLSDLTSCLKGFSVDFLPGIGGSRAINLWVLHRRFEMLIPTKPRSGRLPFNDTV